MSRINIYGTDPYNGERTLEGWFDPSAAVETIEGATEWDGDNMVPVHGGGYAYRYTLYRTPGGRWVELVSSRWVRQGDQYRFLDDEAARTWLITDNTDTSAKVLERYFGELDDEAGPGRPEIGGEVKVRLGELLGAVDEWAAAQDVSRAEAVRRLVSAGLDALTTANA